MARIISMSRATHKPMEMAVAQPPRRSKWRRWWPWLSVLGVVAVFLLFLGYAMLMGSYRQAQLNQLIDKLRQQGITTRIDYVSPDWMGTIANYLPGKVQKWFSVPVSSVTLQGEKITADSVVQCLQLPTVRALSFYDTPNINDAALKPLADVQSLSCLELHNTQVSGEGFPSLEHLPKFWDRIQIEKCPLTEAGVEHLLKCAPIVVKDSIHLESIKLGNVEVTNAHGSKAIKEGELITVRGNFTSPRFSPVRIYMNVGDWYADSSWMSSVSGTYGFIGKNSTQGFPPGRYKLQLGVGLDVRSEVRVDIGEVEFEVKPR